MKSLRESLLDDEDDVVDKLNTKTLIEYWLEKYNIKNYKINKDNTIDAIDVYLRRYPESELPSYIQFRNIVGSFSIYGSKLNTLKGCPKEVGVDFNCCDCKLLQTLKYAPEKVGRGFYCAGCDSLKTLEGAPKEVGRNFNCEFCKNLKSLKGITKKVYILSISSYFDEDDAMKFCNFGRLEII